MPEDALLLTKLLVPLPRPGVVERARLAGRMTDGLRLGRRLTLVSAPPGFGKTTLLRHWAAGTGRAVAWLALDDGDNDPQRFVRYVAAAVRQAVAAPSAPPPPAAAEAPVGAAGNAAAPSVPAAAPAGAQAQDPQAQLVRLMNEVATGGCPLLLVLDDYHAIRNFAAHDLVAFLLTGQPPCLHLAIGTREDPPLPIARLRARDQLTEIREAALRFTPAEADGFLNGTLHLGLSPSATGALTARTEGWITGLQLAGLALSQPDDASAPAKGAEQFVAAFAGDDRYVVDYLMAEVLERMPADLREFLSQTAVLERLSGPLCDALTGRDDSQAVLEQLASTNSFVICLDNRREWYRYHVLFADVLRLALSPAERADLHRRAARWYGAAGAADESLRHAAMAAEIRLPAPAGGARVPEQPLIEPLSEREIEVLRLVADGFSNAEIGQKLYIATGTVKRHINNIYGKLDVVSRTQAVAKARALGLLDRP